MIDAQAEAVGSSSGADRRAIVAELESVAMLAGLASEDLDELAARVRFVPFAPGDVMWRQAAPIPGLMIIIDGELVVTRRLPGEAGFELARATRGAVAGVQQLRDGGLCVGTAEASTPGAMLFMPHEDFHAWLQLGSPAARRFRMRMVENTCERVRTDHAWIAAALGAGGWLSGARDGATATSCPPCLRPTVRPQLSYLCRLPFFGAMTPDEISDLLDGGEILEVDPGCVILAEGEVTDRCYVVLNGAVEDVITRTGENMRVRFAGPGQACCFLGFLDGRPATATSRARERTVMLEVPAEDFHARMAGRDPVDVAFAAAITADLVATLAGTASPKTYLSRSLA